MMLPLTWQRARRLEQPRRGFTLVELLTVISVIGILAAIVIPAIGGVQTKARAAISANNLRQIGATLELYSQDNKGYMPAPKASPGAQTSGSATNPSGGSWMVELLKYLEGSYRMDGATGQITVQQWPKVMQCAEFVAREGTLGDDTDVRGFGMMVYPYRPDPTSSNQPKAFYTERQKKANLPDPANNVVAASSNSITLEPNASGQFTKTGKDYQTGDPYRHGPVAQYLFLDGSVRTLMPDEAARSLRAKQSR